MLQILWHIFRQLWFGVPGFARCLSWVRATRPAPRHWRARARHVWHRLLHRFTLSSSLSILFRLQVTAWAASGTSLSSPRAVLPSLYLLFRRILT
ncbi:MULTISPECIES: hypothetical protein [Rufibacter]|uniref:Uncharacterized protein n=1 Tax=Rufibacter quisquiliarum TaxID=1549639 RepID=A0A839GKK9_9BACT|nr:MULTISPECIES: hypothetical protein [Rufibacter]MBA9075556.1 hypothetical protein [Rufibacter quisquiliarum]